MYIRTYTQTMPTHTCIDTLNPYVYTYIYAMLICIPTHLVILATTCIYIHICYTYLHPPLLVILATTCIYIHICYAFLYPHSFRHPCNYMHLHTYMLRLYMLAPIYICIIATLCTHELKNIQCHTLILIFLSLRNRNQLFNSSMDLKLGWTRLFNRTETNLLSKSLQEVMKYLEKISLNPSAWNIKSGTT